MKFDLHHFHIPVMGTGHSVDTPIRVAPFGISSVISLVDDLLLEKIRKFYCEKFELPYQRIGKADEDFRAKRTTAYLDMVQEVVRLRLEKIKSLPFFEENDKRKYFEMLPESSALKKTYKRLISLGPDQAPQSEIEDLTNQMEAGSIDVNIMVKLDRRIYSSKGEMLDEGLSDARAALRGYAYSKLKSSIIFSAGINQPLFSDIVKYQDFYRDALGEIKKKIVLKVSDFRSALIQGKFLARKGLEVSEFRIESGLNCGGHAFASNGLLLPVLLKEISEKRQELVDNPLPQVERYYKKQGWEIPAKMRTDAPKITVQGGIGTSGEQERMLHRYNLDRTGWASPFLLVPEATPVDDTTRQLLAQAGEEDLYLSPSSPLGVPFNNVRGSGSAQWHQERRDIGKPGSPCPKGHLVSNTEFTELPICTASSEYQKMKLEQIATSDMSENEKQSAEDKIHVKQCICDHLANGALIDLGIQKEERSPQSICPGPNAAWFDRYYSLQEMVDHIYGRIDSLAPAQRPHMYAKEISMYVEYFGQQLDICTYTKSEVDTLNEFVANLTEGIAYCLEEAEGPSYGDENLESIKVIAHEQNELFQALISSFEKAKEAAQAQEA